MLPFTSEAHHQAHEFLVREAELLDHRRFGDWLELFTEDIVYRMPVRVTRASRLEETVLDDMSHFDEDMFSLRKRVERLETEYAWTEEPPSRTRHFVTNVRTDATEREDELLVRSNLLLFRSRGDIREPDLLSAERSDVLRRVDGEWKLARRDILIDESVLRTQNLAIFL